MTFPTPTGDPTSTEQHTTVSTPVNPAPASLTFPSSTQNYTSSLPVIPLVSDAEKYEQRIRDLMSAKDKAIAESARAQQRTVELQQQAELQQKQHSELIEGATKATESLLHAKQQLEIQHQRLEAENLKLKLLAREPDLLPYAEFIPASTQEADITASIERFRVAQQVNRPNAAGPEMTSMRGIYPANQSTPIPAAQPAAAPIAQYEQTLEDFTSRVQALDQLDPLARTAAFTKLIQEAEVLAKRQFGQ